MGEDPREEKGEDLGGKDLGEDREKISGGEGLRGERGERISTGKGGKGS